MNHQPVADHLLVEPTIEASVARALALLLEAATEAIAARGLFRLLLAGGSTPRKLYARLAQADAIEWPRWELWLGDERNVPPDHAESNFRMVRESLLEPLAQQGRVPARVRRWQTEAGALPAAELYAHALAALSSSPAQPPTFDLVLLGMGADGHTAGLFPGTAALDERERLTVAYFVPQLHATRLTVTYTVLNAARATFFLVTGSEKAHALREVLRGPYDPVRLPIQAARPSSGPSIFIVDAAAAVDLELSPPAFPE